MIFTKNRTLFKFLLLLALLVGYFGYLSWEYDIKTGGIVALLTWSFFVLCTPIADAGFLLDFPIRLLFGIRMIVIETLVWVIAITLNMVIIFINPDIYETTLLTSLFHKILITPIPYWSIIVICGIGTFLSIHFGDDVIDTIKPNSRHKKSKTYMLVNIVLFVFILLLYSFLLKSLHIYIPA